MFKKSLLLAAFAFAGQAWAHGNLAHQAQEAVSTALDTLQANEPREHLRLFKSVGAELIAHETFQVKVGFSGGAELNYRCWEDETIDPVAWKCDKQ